MLSEFWLHSFTKIRKMAGLRATQLNLHSQNSENSSVVANAKNALLGKSTTMGRSTRTVMGDLGNNAAGSNRAGLRAKDNNAPVQKPGRTLAKKGHCFTETSSTGSGKAGSERECSSRSFYP